MCYVIVTVRSITWCLLTFLDTVLMLAVLMSPKWLIGPQQMIGFSQGSHNSTLLSSQRFQDTEYLPVIIRNRFSAKRETLTRTYVNKEIVAKVPANEISNLLDSILDKRSSYGSFEDLMIDPNLGSDPANNSIIVSGFSRKLGADDRSEKYGIPNVYYDTLSDGGEIAGKFQGHKALIKRDMGQVPIKSTDSTMFQPTLGIYTRCTKLRTHDRTYADDCGPFIRKFREGNTHFPDYWKVVLVLYSCGSVLMLLTSFTSIVSCFVRSIFRKSIFILSGIVQAFAGLFFTLSLILYPMGWDTTRVQRVCGPKAEAYMMGDCEAGWALYAGIGGAGLCFLCSLLTIQAEISTSNDKVQNEILEGNTFICLV